MDQIEFKRRVQSQVDLWKAHKAKTSPDVTKQTLLKWMTTAERIRKCIKEGELESYEELIHVVACIRYFGRSL